ncbi:IS1595 family transposase [Erythrobacter rubeus]|uniref:IS1595 family transposase n=1 Tax=Erythrobacter rubeus TaxID=2760803 RepID=A0ABR8KZA5_9SPHN|nr:IS1595 family transposase [Erythrobacter rubeus]MBD2843551.1 IS1595 family transposase [Erythrobacter rubeus]
MTFTGTSIVEFFDRFPDERACLAQVFRTKWGDHSPCPNCGVIGAWAIIRGTKKYNHRCRKQFSPMKGTAFYRTNLSLMAVFYALQLFANSSSGIRSTFIRKQLGIGLRAAHRLCNQVRLHIAAYDRAQQLGGPGKTVSVDELYLRHSVNRRQKRHDGAIVLGFACEGKVLCGIVPDRKRATLHRHIRRHVRPGSSVITDDWLGYKKLEQVGYHHISVNHSLGYFFDEFGRSTNEIETFWASMRRSLRLYHQTADHNLWRFLAEIEFRYNHRFSKVSPFDILISHWPDLESFDRGALQQRFDWRVLSL